MPKFKMFKKPKLTNRTGNDCKSQNYNCTTVFFFLQFCNTYVGTSILILKTNIKCYRNNVKQAIDVDKPSTSTCQSNGNPVAPPRTRRSSSHNSLLSAESGPCDIQAANAISGGVQANQDLPYMTPPLLMLLPQPPQQPQSNSPQQHFSGDSQDSSKYLLLCRVIFNNVFLDLFSM